MYRQPFRALLAVAALAISLVAAPAFSQSPPKDVVRVDILPGWRTENGTHMAGLRIRLAPGWKTYWRSPGAAGIPPSFSWSGSRNLESVRFLWPTPKVQMQSGLKTVGYSGEVIIPMEFTPKPGGAGRAITLRTQMELGVCQDICLPTTVTLRAELPAGGRPDPAILASIRNRPATEEEAGVGRVICEVEPISDGLRVTATIEVPDQGGEEFSIMELPDERIWISEAITRRKGNRLISTAEMVPPNAAPFMLSRSDLRITILGKNGAVDVRGCSAG